MSGLNLSRRLTAEEKERFAYRLMALLAKQAKRYTAGESSSIAADTAQELLESLQYTLFVAAGETDGNERLLNEDLTDLTELGREKLRQGLEQTKRLWEAVCRTAPDIENLYYADTLRGIGDFLKRYDLILFAHMKPPCIDYPLLSPVDESLQGITYTREYLRRLLAENLILSRLDAKAVQRVLRAMGMNKNDAYLNLCEQPLTNAVGLSLLKKDVRKIGINDAERKKITELLIYKTHGEREKLLCAAANNICNSMQITDDYVRDYTALFARSLLPRLEAALEFGDVSNIFI